MSDRARRLAALVDDDSDQGGGEQGGVVEGPEEERGQWVYKYSPANDIHFDLRTEPSIDAKRSSRKVLSGRVFDVCGRVKEEATGVTYLRLADGSGWAFDFKPGVGVMCEELPDARPR
eukprot:Hpha_TRINITY_DN15889_c3_g3::TRINITY_DN15889_c3_g3_i1::g.191424::m.191424